MPMFPRLSHLLSARPKKRKHHRNSQTKRPSTDITDSEEEVPAITGQPAPTVTSQSVPAGASQSVQWRAKGNEYYISMSPGLAPLIKMDRGIEALKCYQKAFDTGMSEEEKSSAAKNIGMVNWRLLNVVCEQGSTDNRRILFHCKQAFKHFSYAFLHGQQVKPSDWVKGVLTSSRACWEDLSNNILINLDIDFRCQVYYEVAMVIEMDSIKADCFYTLAETLFHRGVIAVQKEDFKKCLGVIHECYMPINEARRLCSDRTTKERIDSLEYDITVHQYMAESIQARVTGDGLFEKVVMDQETLNIDMVWDVIDWYKKACLQTRDMTEVELEAIAVGRLGRVYDKVLKLKTKAKEYYKHVLQLAQSMAPRIVTGEDWYKEATEVLAKYQAETVQAEEESKNKEKAEILKELEEEMKQLNLWKEKTNTDFLTILYKTFPPKKEGQKLVLPTSTDEDWHGKMKKTLQQAVVHYHPDTVDVDAHGKKWKVLSEEITKYCTQRYEQMK